MPEFYIIETKYLSVTSGHRIDKRRDSSEDPFLVALSTVHKMTSEHKSSPFRGVRYDFFHLDVIKGQCLRLSRLANKIEKKGFSVSIRGPVSLLLFRVFF